MSRGGTCQGGRAVPRFRVIPCNQTARRRASFTGNGPVQKRRAAPHNSAMAELTHREAPRAPAPARATSPSAGGPCFVLGLGALGIAVGEHVQRHLRPAEAGPRHGARRPGPRRGELHPLHRDQRLPPGAAGLQAGRERHGRAAPPAERRRPGGPAGHQAHPRLPVRHGLGRQRRALGRGRAPSWPGSAGRGPGATVFHFSSFDKGPTPRPSRQTRPS